MFVACCIACFYRLKIVMKIIIMMNFNGNMRDLHTDIIL